MRPLLLAFDPRGSTTASICIIAAAMAAINLMLLFEIASLRLSIFQMAGLCAFLGISSFALLRSGIEIATRISKRRRAVTAQDIIWLDIEEAGHRLRAATETLPEVLALRNVTTAGLALGNIKREAEAAYDLLERAR